MEIQKKLIYKKKIISGFEGQAITGIYQNLSVVLFFLPFISVYL